MIALWLALGSAHAFTLFENNFDWTATESYCRYQQSAATGEPECIATGTSNDTVGGAFDLGELGQGEVFDSARPAVGTAVVLGGPAGAVAYHSDVVTLSHRSNQVPGFNPSRNIEYLYVHPPDDNGLTEDRDWYTITPDAGLCLDICMLGRGLDDGVEVQDDWSLTLYSNAGVDVIDQRQGAGCLYWESTGDKLWIEISDASPDLVLETSKSLAHQYYRLIVSNEGGETPGIWRTDADADGFGEIQAGGAMCEPVGGGLVNNSSDCNDNDPDVHPDALEICNGIDDNCNGDPDERLAIGTWYVDVDGDGYAATDAKGSDYCADPGPGFSFLPLDCDDTVATGAAIHPGATEICNGLDDNCNNTVDENLPHTIYWPDLDGDGHGALGEYAEACSPPEGAWALGIDDCAPNDAAIHPGAVEACDGIDQDCDGTIDEGFPCSLWFPDVDGDGQGDADATPTSDCAAPAATGFVANGTDCDDAAAGVRAGAAETCDGIDQDCDGEIDEGVTTTYFQDLDGDGFGTASTAVRACAAPSAAYVTAFGDCDDASADASPEAEEACNDIDDDCDGLVDEGCNPVDIDTAGSCGCATPVAPGPGALFLLPLVALLRRRKGGVALAVSGLVLATPIRAEAFTILAPNSDWPETETYCSWELVDGGGTRCTALGEGNDTEQGAFFLGEIPVGGLIDTDDHTPGTFYSTVIGSNQVTLSHGSHARTLLGAEFWFHYTHALVDALDVDIDWYEIDTVEDQCLTVCLEPASHYDTTPPGVTFPDDWKAVVRDDAGNVLGTATGLGATSACAIDLVSPGGTLTVEVFDETPVGATSDVKFMYRLSIDNYSGLQGEFWPDHDFDGWGDMDEASVFYCGEPLPDIVANNLDCDDDPDTGASIGPGMPEQCDGLDNDCDGTADDGLPFTNVWPDVDGDKWGDIDAAALLVCKVPDGHTVRPGDCDDDPATGAKVQPGQIEVCNGIDDNCDGRIDEGFGTPYWPDTDGDGSGDPDGVPKFTCLEPGTGWSADALDCDDTNAAVNAKATEVCNEIDDDCDGEIDEGFTKPLYYPDADGDGFGAAECPEAFCTDPGEGWSTTWDDCNDASASVHPDATEIAADGIDQDCSGADDCDGDGDGFRAGACGGDDCDDTDAAINPLATETWYDGVDSDCAGDDDWDRDHDGHVDEAYADVYEGDLPADDCNDADDTIVICSVQWVQGGLCATGVGPMAAWPVVGLLAAMAFRRRRALALLAVPSIAMAQESGFDAHGLSFLPHDGDLHDPLVVWRAERQVPMSVGVSGLLEYANDAAVLVTATADGRERTPLVGNLVAFNIGGHFAFHERIGVALAVPVWLFADGEAIEGSGFGLGDLQIALPVGIVLPREDGTGFGLSAIPVLIAPIGAEGKLLGTPGFGGGGWIAAGVGTKKLAFAADVGVLARATGEYENLNGGLGLGFGLSASYALTEYFAVRAEGLMRPTLVENEVSLTESPGEALLSLRGRYDQGLGWTLGGAVPFTRGFGAPKFRVFAGVSWTWGKAPIRDRDGDGFVDEDDACPDVAEVVNGYADTDGCPDALATLRVRVMDPEGVPAANTAVIVDGQQVGITDPDGWLVLADLMPGRALSLSAQPDRDTGTTLWDAVGVDLAEGVQERTLTLGWLPGAVRVIAKDAYGGPIDAQVLFRGPEPRDPGRLGDLGRNLFMLSPGDWTILASADSFGTERRDIVILPDQTSLVVIELTMLPAVVQITREEVLILEQIQFDFDKAEIQVGSIGILEEVSNNLLTQPQILKVEIQGHTDSDGSTRYNADLSQRRMDSVVGYLVGRGVARERIVPVGYGEGCPLVPNTSPENKATNRRVQFIILDPPPASGTIPCHGGQPARRAEPTRLQVTEPVSP